MVSFVKQKSFKQIMRKGLNWISIQATIFQCFLAAHLEKTVSSLPKSQICDFFGISVTDLFKCI